MPGLSVSTAQAELAGLASQAVLDGLVGHDGHFWGASLDEQDGQASLAVLVGQSG